MVIRHMVDKQASGKERELKRKKKSKIKMMGKHRILGKSS